MNDFISAEKVESRIYRIRGQQVMLDSDLATLYGVQTYRLNEQVRRNVGRFPLDFMFRLSDLEWKILISHLAISKIVAAIVNRSVSVEWLGISAHLRRCRPRYLEIPVETGNRKHSDLRPGLASGCHSPMAKSRSASVV
jgi:hypothetical protein